MHTFEVDNVKLSRDRTYKPITAEKSWDHALTRVRYDRGTYSVRHEATGAVLLGCSQVSVLSETGPNALVGAVGIAYNNHQPLSLSPAAIWMTIAQGLSFWINENAEKVRKQFVAHEGKAEILLDVPPSPHWPTVLAAFSEQIAGHIGKKRDLFISDFSTATLDEKVASEVVLMHSMSKYFSYGMRTLCGFPRITLEGSVEDWEKIHDRVRAFSELGAVAGDAHMKTWVSALLPTLEAFTRSAKGNPEKEFWKGLYRADGGSGGPYISGHILNFFPYIVGNGKLHQNPYLGPAKKGGFHNGCTSDQFDRGLSRVDVKWDYLGKQRKVEFHGGFVGVSLSAEDSTVRPECGWGVLDVTEKTADPAT